MNAPHNFHLWVFLFLSGCEQEGPPDCEEGGDYSFAADAGCTQAMSDGFYAGYHYGARCEEVPPGESGGAGYSAKNLVCRCKTVGSDVGEGWDPCGNEWYDGYQECFEDGLLEGNQAGWTDGQCP